MWPLLTSSKGLFPSSFLLNSLLSACKARQSFSNLSFFCTTFFSCRSFLPFCGIQMENKVWIYVGFFPVIGEIDIYLYTIFLTYTPTIFLTYTLMTIFLTYYTNHIFDITPTIFLTYTPTIFLTYTLMTIFLTYTPTIFDIYIHYIFAAISVGVKCLLKLA